MGRRAGELYTVGVKPHPRIRKTVKWGGAVVSVLLVVVWIGSGWYNATWVSPHDLQAYVSRGQLVLIIGRVTNDRFTQNIFELRSDPGALYWGGRWRKFPTYTLVYLPVWPLAVAAAVAALAAWRLDRIAWLKSRPHLCPKCTYDRTGLAAGSVCPECGAAAASA